MGAVDRWLAVGGGGVGNWGDEISVYGEDGETLMSKIYPTPS